ncbi:MAG: LysR family transcriptional regulator [Bergeyella sp.]|nr:LysR family transcriptional regulator [Bergeyella sp.]
MIRITNRLELRHLNYFKVLVEELHYRKASERLFISQSALSQQIKNLEEILEVILFERTNRRVSLSHAGELFYNDVLQILNKVETAVANIRMYAMGNTGQIGIGFVASAITSVLPSLLKQFNVNCPNIRFRLDELNNAEQLKALQNETLDLGFMRSNNLPHGFVCKRIYIETFSLVLPAEHPVTEDDFRDISQFRDENFILFPNEQSPQYYQQIINICADYGFLPKVAHRSIHTPTIFKMVENGMGISVIPTSLAFSENTNIKFLELKGVPQKTALYAVWKRQNHNPALPYFLKMLVSV